MYWLLIFSANLLYQEKVSANPTFRCNQHNFITNSSVTILSQGYPRETKAGSCKNYFAFTSNSSMIAFEIEDINMYYTNNGDKICDATVLFGRYSVPCMDNDPQCIVFTNDRYCLSSGLPEKYYRCIIIHSDTLYVPVHLRFQGRNGTESRCANPYESAPSCIKTNKPTFPRGLKMKYRQMYCQKDHAVDKEGSDDSSGSVSVPEENDDSAGSVGVPEENEREKFAILFAVIGVSALLLAAFTLFVVRRYRFKNTRARKRMMRNHGSTATMVNSIIYGSATEYQPPSPTQDGTSTTVLETSTNDLRTEEGEYCYIDVDLNKNGRHKNFRFACQYRRDGVSYIQNEERKNAIYEET